MAQGFEDWQTQVNISGQLIRPLLARTYLGYPIELYSSFDYGIGGSDYLINIYSPGITLGGYIEIRGTLSRKNDTFVIYSDGHVSTIWSAFKLNEYGIITPDVTFLYQIKYDDTNFLYIIGIKPGLVFDSGFKILFNELTGVAITIKCVVVYGLPL